MIGYFRRILFKIDKYIDKNVQKYSRKVISLLIAVCFVFSMTGLDTILVYAFESDYHQPGTTLDNPANTQSYSDFVGNNQPDAFLDILTTETDPKNNEATVNDTTLNVLKSEYGDLLDTASLMTIAERSLTTGSLDTAANLVMTNQDILMPVQEPSSQEKDQVTSTDLQQTEQSELMETGSLTEIIEMGGIETEKRLDEAGEQSDYLPTAAVVAKENEDTASSEPEETQATDETDPSVEVEVVKDFDDSQPQDVIDIPQENENDVIENADIIEIQDDQSVVETTEENTDNENQLPETNGNQDDSGSLITDVANRIKSLLGMEESVKDEILEQPETPEHDIQVTGKTDNNVVTGTVDETEADTDGQSNQETDKVAVPAEKNRGVEDLVESEADDTEQEGTPGEDDESEDVSKGEEEEEEEDEEGNEFSDQVLAMLGMSDEQADESDPENQPDTPDEGDSELWITEGDDEPTTDEVAVDVLVPVEEASRGNIKDIDEDPSPVLTEMDEEPAGEIERDDTDEGKGDVPVKNTDSELDDTNEIAIIGPKTIDKNGDDSEEDPQIPSVDFVLAAAVETDTTPGSISPLNIDDNLTASLVSGPPVSRKIDTVIGTITELVNQSIVQVTGPGSNTNPTILHTKVIGTREVIKPAEKKVADTIGTAPNYSTLSRSENMIQGAVSGNGNNTQQDLKVYASMNLFDVLSMASDRSGRTDGRVPPLPDVGLDDVFASAWPEYSTAGWDAIQEEYATRHHHRNSPEDKLDEPDGCAAFLISPLGKFTMFVFSAVLTVVTLGTATPLLLIIIITIQFLLTCVPMPEELATLLTIVSIVLCAYAAAINAAAKAGEIAVKEYAKKSLETMLKNSVFKQEFIKKALAPLLVMCVIELFPDAGVLEIAMVSLLATIVSSGVAAELSGGDFWGGILEGLQDTFLNEDVKFTDKEGRIGAFLTSKFVKVIVDLTVSAEVAGLLNDTKIGKITGMMMGALTVGLIDFTVAAESWTAADKIKPEVGGSDLLETIVAPIISTGVSAYYTHFVAPHDVENGYSERQAQNFGNKLGEFMGAMIPTFNSTTSKWVNVITRFSDAMDKLFSSPDEVAGASASSDTNPYDEGGSKSDNQTGSDKDGEAGVDPGHDPETGVAINESYARTTGGEADGAEASPGVSQPGKTVIIAESVAAEEIGEMESTQLQPGSEFDQAGIPRQTDDSQQQSQKPPEVVEDQGKKGSGNEKVVNDLDKRRNEEDASRQIIPQEKQAVPNAEALLLDGTIMPETELQEEKTNLDESREAVEPEPGKEDQFRAEKEEHMEKGIMDLEEDIQEDILRRDEDLLSEESSKVDHTGGGEGSEEVSEDEQTQKNNNEYKQQLQNAAATGELPAMYTPAMAGETDKTSIQSLEPKATENLQAAGDVLNKLRAADMLPQDRADLTIEQFENSNGDQVLRVSGTGENGEQKILAASVQSADGNEYTTLFGNNAENQAEAAPSAVTYTNGIADADIQKNNDQENLVPPVKDAAFGPGLRGPPEGEKSSPDSDRLNDALAVEPAAPAGIQDPRQAINAELAAASQSSDGAFEKKKGPQPGEKVLHTIKLPDGTTTQAEFEYDPDKAYQEVEADNGKTYQLSFSETGEVVQTLEKSLLKKSFFGARVAWMDVTTQAVQNPDGQTIQQPSQLYGQKLLFARDGKLAEVWEQNSEGKWTQSQTTFQAEHKGVHYAALLDADNRQLPPEELKNKVMLHNARNAQEIFGNDPYYSRHVLADLKKQGITPDSDNFQEAFSRAVHTLATDMAQTAVQDANQYADIQLPENAAYKSARGMVARSEMTLATVDPTQVRPSEITTHAAASGDVEVMHQAVNYVTKAAERNTLAAAAQQTFELSLGDAGILPVEKIEMALNTMEVIAAAGAEHTAAYSGIFQQAQANVEDALLATRPDGIALAQAIRLNEVVPALTADESSSGTSESTSQLDVMETADEFSSATSKSTSQLDAMHRDVMETVERYAEPLQPGQSRIVEGLGTITKTENNQIMLQQQSDEKNLSVQMNFKPVLSPQSGNTLQVDTLTISDAQAVRQVFESTSTGMVLKSRATASLVTMPDGSQAAVTMMLPPNRSSNAYKTLQTINTEKYIATTDLQGNTTLEKLYGPQAVPEMLISGSVGSLRFDSENRPVSFDGQSIRAFQNPDPAVLAEALIQAGLTPEQAQQQVTVLNYSHKIVYLSGQTLFVGDRQDFLSGTYHVVGVNTFGGDTEPLLYTASFVGHVLENAYLSDGQILEFIKGNPKNYTATLHSEDGLRDHVTVYKNGELIGSKLILRDVGNAELIYTRQGNLTPESISALKKGDFSGVTFSEIPGQGFKLSNNETGKEYRFNMSGRRMLPSETGGSSGIGGGTQEIKEFDVQQKRILTFAHYNSAEGLSITNYSNATKHSIMISDGGEGNLTKSITISNALGEFTQPIRDFEFASQGPGGEWQLTGYRDFQTVTTDRGEIISLSVSKGVEPGANWTGVENGKVYSELVDDTFQQTGTRKEMTITLENGQEITATVSSQGMVNPTPGTAEINGRIYAEQPSGEFKYTGRVMYDTAIVNGFEYRVKTTVSALQTHSSQSFSKQGITYTKTAGEYIPTAENKYVAIGNEIQMASKSLLTEHALWRVSDTEGNVFVELEARVAEQYPGHQVGDLVLQEKAGRFVNCEDLYVRRMTNLRTGKVSGADIYGNRYSIDEAGKLGKGKIFTMLTKVVGTVETAEGVIVTLTVNLLEGEHAQATGTDMHGNSYAYDSDGKLGEKDALVKSIEVIGTEIKNGAIVTKTHNLFTNKITGSDMYGNVYGMIEKKIDGATTVENVIFGMTSRMVGTELKDGITVTVMESLLDTNQNGKVEAGEKKITGSDMYGNVYGMIEHKNGTAEFGMTSRVLETVVEDGMTVTVMESLLDTNQNG
ncbi:hypothetical protein K8S19_11120, partial [bacterium]|nr:hypothetical protein [bacterium]